MVVPQIWSYFYFALRELVLLAGVAYCVGMRTELCLEPERFNQVHNLVCCNGIKTETLYSKNGRSTVMKCGNERKQFLCKRVRKLNMILIYL